jgi:hypothetical protein
MHERVLCRRGQGRPEMCDGMLRRSGQGRKSLREVPGEAGKERREEIAPGSAHDLPAARRFGARLFCGQKTDRIRWSPLGLLVIAAGRTSRLRNLAPPASAREGRAPTAPTYLDCSNSFFFAPEILRRSEFRVFAGHPTSSGHCRAHRSRSWESRFRRPPASRDWGIYRCSGGLCIHHRRGAWDGFRRHRGMKLRIIRVQRLEHDLGAGEPGERHGRPVRRRADDLQLLVQLGTIRGGILERLRFQLSRCCA